MNGNIADGSMLCHDNMLREQRVSEVGSVYTRSSGGAGARYEAEQLFGRKISPKNERVKNQSAGEARRDALRGIHVSNHIRSRSAKICCIYAT